MQQSYLGVKKIEGGVGFDRGGVAEASWKAPGEHALCSVVTTSNTLIACASPAFHLLLPRLHQLL